MVQRCVIIQKDEKGYGLTVSGDNPVFVQSVKEGETFYNQIVKNIKCMYFERTSVFCVNSFELKKVFFFLNIAFA